MKGVPAMGILTRFKDIMSANINALLDKAEDPEKMIDQYLRNLESDLGNVKAETAAVMADEKRAKRELDECNQEIAKLQSYAEKAITAGNEADARAFLEKKQTVASKLSVLQQQYDLSKANADKMRQMHDKLVKDISDLNTRRDAIKAKVKVAKTQQKLNEIGGSGAGVAGNMSAFEKMEAKADRMLDEANAMSELNAAAEQNDVSALEAKYDAASSADASNSAVDDELAALKAKMGM